MDPISLGIAAATAFAAKVIDRLGERAGDKVADEAAPVRDRIKQLLDEAGHGTGPLQQVEQAPDSTAAVSRLATAIARGAEVRPDAAERLAQFMALLQPDATVPRIGKFQVHVSGEATVGSIYNADRDIIVRAD
jgi:hypothetical protein